jgi:hypothetical protein
MIAGVGHPPWVVILTDLKNMAVCQEWDKQDFNFQKHILGISRFTHELKFEAIFV